MTIPSGTETLDVVVVGDLMVDVLAVMSGPLAHGSDTPSRITTAGGGSAANVASWLAELGVRTSYVGKVGDDALGRESVAGLTLRGVEAWVSTADALTTGTCVVLVEQGGERSMLPDTGANAALTPDDLPHRLFRPGAHLHLSGYTLLHEGSRDAGLTALALAQAADMTVSIDPSSAALVEAAGVARFLEWTRGVDLLLANQEEAGCSPAPTTSGPRRRPSATPTARSWSSWAATAPSGSRGSSRRARRRSGGRRRHDRGGRLLRRRLPGVLAAAPGAGDRAGRGNRVAASAVTRVGARP